MPCGRAPPHPRTVQCAVSCFTRALHLQSAAPASPAIGVVHQRRVAHPADVQGLQLLPVRTGVSVGSRVVAEPLFRKATTATGRAAPWLRHIRRDPRRLAPGDVLDLEVSLVSHSIDPLDAEARAPRVPRLGQQPKIGNLAMRLLLGNQLVLRVHRDLLCTPPPRSATVHRPGVGAGQQELVLATLPQRLTVRFETRLALSQRRNLLCQIPPPQRLNLLGVTLVLPAIQSIELPRDDSRAEQTIAKR